MSRFRTRTTVFDYPTAGSTERRQLIEGTTSPYLPPESAFGCRYVFDPDSSVLRESFLRPGRFRTEPIRSAYLAEDLSFLRNLLETACAGYDELTAHPDFEPDEFFSAWHATVTGSGPYVSALDGVVRPVRTLRRSVPNEHLIVPGLDSLISDDPSIRFSEYQAQDSATELGPDDMPEHTRRDTFRTVPMLSTTGQVDHVATVSATGELESFVAGPSTFSRRPETARIGPDQAAYSWQFHGDTGVITLRSFQTGRPRVRAQLKAFVDDYPLHRSHRRLIFDLRGNSGGDLSPIRAWLALACSTPWQSWSMVEIMGPIAVCKRWNWAIGWQIRNGTVDTTEAVEERRLLADNWESLAASQPTVKKSATRSGRGDFPLDSNVYAVVDRHSGSSGELAAIELKNALGARIVGERTAGGCATGQASRFVLPATGLLVQMPTQSALFDRPVEGVGWPVDAYLEDIKSPSDVLVSQLPALDAVFDQA